jgi:hypothetical protein
MSGNSVASQTTVAMLPMRRKLLLSMLLLILLALFLWSLPLLLQGRYELWGVVMLDALTVNTGSCSSGVNIDGK